MTADYSDFWNLVAEAIAWEDYTAALRHVNRHVVSDGTYFDALLSDCLEAQHELQAGQLLYRARLMPLAREHDDNPLPSSEMGAPPPERASAGRLNPKGIPYFYAALDHETAIAELRPWRKARISVTTFHLAASIVVVDLTGRYTPSRSAKVKFAGIVAGRPVHRDNPWAYLGSQYFAETIKAKGPGGILYDSSMRGGGINLALFSEDAVAPESDRLYEVAGVKYATNQICARVNGGGNR